MNDSLHGEIKLNRLFNIFNFKYYKTAAIFNGLLILILVFSRINDPYVNYYLSKMDVAVIVAVNLIMLVTTILNCPKKFFFDGSKFEFEERESVRVYPGKGGLRWVKVSYCVREITGVEFRQNPIEKMFNVGRVLFSGKATYTANRYVDRINERDTFIICGIKNFDKFKKRF